MRQLTIVIVLWIAPLAGGQDAQDPKLSVFYEANRLYNIKAYTVGAEKFREFLRTQPKHAKAPDARYGLALCLFEKKEFAEAEKLFEGLAKLPKNPDPDRVFILRGQCLLAMNRPADAAAVFDAGSKRPGAPNPAKAQCFAGLVESRTREKKWEEVVAVAGRFLQLQKNPADPLAGRVRFHLAAAQHELGKFPEAVTGLSQLIAATGGAEKSPFGQPALFLLAESQRELGKFAEAAKNYELARKHDGPLGIDSLFRIGYVRFQEGKFDDAIRALETLQKDHADSQLLGSARLYLGRCFFEKKDFRRADQTLKAVPSAEAAFWRGRALEEDKRIDEAVAVLAKAVATFPKDPLFPDLLFAHGNALMAKEDFARAGAEFGRLVKAFPDGKDTMDAIRLQAFCLHRTEKYAESLRACETFLKKPAGQPPSKVAEIHFLKAENLLRLEKSPEAEAAYAKFTASFKDHPQAAAAQFRIGDLRYRREDWKGARESLRGVDPNKVGNPELIGQLDFMIGDCAFRIGDDDAGAERHFAKFIAEKPVEMPNRDTARLGLAMTIQKRKDAVRAAAEFSNLVREYPQSPHRPRALLERGRIEYERKDLAAARASFKELFDKHADHPFRVHAAHQLGWISLDEKKDEEARGHFRFVIGPGAAKASADLVADSHFQLAMIAVRLEAFPEARQHLEKLAAGKLPENGPKLDAVFYYLGHSQLKMEDWPAAAQSFARGLKEIPDSTRRENLLYELAWCEESRKRPQEAIKHYTELLAKFPDGKLAGSSAVKLGELHYAAGNIDATLQLLGPRIGKLAAQDPELASRAAFRLGWCHLKKEAYPEAAKSFESVLANPQAEASMVPAAAYQAAEAKLLLKEYAAAAAHYDRAAKEKGAGDDIREQASVRLGECHGLLDKWPDSERVFREFAQRFPQSRLLRRSQLGLGWALENQKRFPEAIAEYTKAVGVADSAGEKPRDETAARSQFQIGECWLAQKEFDRAIAEFVKVELHYGFPQWSSNALLEMGNAFLAKGDRDSARARFEEVMKQFPQSDAATVAKQLLQQN